ncbi:unnamed protein product [Caenorhabditis nigoni]
MSNIFFHSSSDRMFKNLRFHKNRNGGVPPRDDSKCRQVLPWIPIRRSVFPILRLSLMDSDGHNSWIHEIVHVAMRRHLTHF